VIAATCIPPLSANATMSPGKRTTNRRKNPGVITA